MKARSIATRCDSFRPEMAGAPGATAAAAAAAAGAAPRTALHALADETPPGGLAEALERLAAVAEGGESKRAAYPVALKSADAGADAAARAERVEALVEAVLALGAASSVVAQQARGAKLAALREELRRLRADGEAHAAATARLRALGTEHRAACDALRSHAAVVQQRLRQQLRAAQCELREARGARQRAEKQSAQQATLLEARALELRGRAERCAQLEKEVAALSQRLVHLRALPPASPRAARFSGDEAAGGSAASAAASPSSGEAGGDATAAAWRAAAEAEAARRQRLQHERDALARELEARDATIAELRDALAARERARAAAQREKEVEVARVRQRWRSKLALVRDAIAREERGRGLDAREREVQEAQRVLARERGELDEQRARQQKAVAALEALEAELGARAAANERETRALAERAASLRLQEESLRSLAALREAELQRREALLQRRSGEEAAP
jgi:hypothetical protein